MKTVFVQNGVVTEVIPNYALPPEKWYGEEFAAHCVEAPYEVEQHWTYDAETGTFSPPKPAEAKEVDPAYTSDDLFAALLGT